jgi:hypothetical protein
MYRITDSSFAPETIRLMIVCQNLRISSPSTTGDMSANSRLAIIAGTCCLPSSHVPSEMIRYDLLAFAFIGDGSVSRNVFSL